MPMFRIVETDNYGGDYPNESFLPLPPMNQSHAVKVCEAINKGYDDQRPRYWKVEPVGYELQPGFEP